MIGDLTTEGEYVKYYKESGPKKLNLKIITIFFVSGLGYI